MHPDHATDAFHLFDDDARVLEVNRQACKDLGYTRDEMIGMTPFDFDPDVTQADLDDIGARLIAGELVAFDARHRRKDGSIFPVEVRIRRITLHGREYRLSLTRDLTERKREEAALLESESRFRAYIDNATDAFYLFDDQSRILDVNYLACKDMGYTRDEMIGMTPLDLDPDVTQARIDEVRERLRAGELVAFDTRHRRKDGSTYPVEVRIRWITLHDRTYALSLARNITERKRTEQALRDSADRLQMLSRQLLIVQEAERRHLARELHDEIGQNLTGLKMSLESRGSVTPEVARVRLEQARNTIDDLLARVRGLSFDLRPAALDQLGLMPALLGLFERYMQQTGISVHFKHQGLERRFLPEIETTAYRIVQEAITNIARHAGVNSATVRAWAEPAALNLQIEDQGRGFEPEAVLRIPRSGGLVGMKERVDILEGRLTIESRPDAGTQITAELPVNA